MKRIISALLSVITAFSAAVLCAAASESTQIAPQEAIDAFANKAAVLISSSDFLTLGKAGMINGVYPSTDYMSVSEYTVENAENMTFAKAVKIQCHTAPESWIKSSVRIDFNTSSDAYKAMSAGDTLLLKYTVRTLESAGGGKLSVRLWNSASQDYNIINQKSVLSISDAWQTYYYPITAQSAEKIPNQLIFKTSAAEQSILIGDFQLLHYGTSVTEQQLHDALTAAGAEVTYHDYCDYYITAPEYAQAQEPDEPEENGGKGLIMNQHFIKNAYTSSDKGTITKTAITAAESESCGLGFTDTLTASCATASSAAITDFGVLCEVDLDAAKAAAGDIVLLTFYARAKAVNTPLRAAILGTGGAVLTNTAGKNSDSAAHTYYIPTQWTKICMPVTVSGEVGKLAFYMGELESSVEIGGVSLAVTDGTKTQYQLPKGYFLCEPYTRLVIDYSEDRFVEKSNIQKCVDLEIHGDYLYAIGDKKLWIISIPEQKIVGTVSGLGEVRQIAITEDAKTAVVTSRVDGAFVIALDDKTNPYVAGRCDTLEYATGVAIADNKAYITNRVFGTEIIDISDRTLPKNIAILRTGEAQSCEIVGTTLYAGCWGDKRVEAWDVSQPSKPVPINKNIAVQGKGDGLCVMDNIMYVATGHEESYQASRSINNVGWGLGNGMVIYDISDLANPVRLSTVKIDDHFFVTGNDFWGVKVARKDNKIYAYMTNTFNGVYIYDVTDPKAPIRLAVIELTVTKENNASKYASLLSSYGSNTEASNWYFPYDTSLRHNSPIGGIAVDDGKIYIGGTNVGIAAVSSEDAGDILYRENREIGDASPEEADGSFYDIDTAEIEASGLCDVRYVLAGGQVYGVDYKDGLIYAACGNQGIKVLDSALNIIREYPARSGAIVSEVVIKGNRLYTAEGLSGIAIYEIGGDGHELTEISRYISAYSPGHSSIYTVKFIRLSPDGNFVLCDSGSSHSELVDFTDLSNPVRWNGEGAVNNGWNPHSGLLYWRQITTSAVGGRYMCVWGNARTMYLYDFGENPEESSPVLKCTVSTSGMTQGGGIAGLTGKNSRYAIGTLGGQFFVFDPEECSESTSLSSLARHNFTGNTSDQSVVGKPTVYGDYMFVTNRITGYCWVIDLSELDVDGGVFSARVIASFNVTGSPDLARVCGDSIVYPLGNQGILAVTLPAYSDNKDVFLSFATANAAPVSEPCSGGRLTVRDSGGNIRAVFYESGTNSFAAYLPKGTYSYDIYKKGYVAYSGAFEVTDSGANAESIRLIPGDVAPSASVKPDGKVNMMDVLSVLKNLYKSSAASLYDINGDGTVSVSDLMLTLWGFGRAYN